MAEHDSRDGIHVGIIMDGNGRWAQARGLPRLAGHRKGVEAVREAVEAAQGLGISVLTLYAFSSDNWKRPVHETRGLMQLFERYLVGERERCVDNGVRLNVIGRRDRLAPRLVRAIRESEVATAAGRRLYLRLAVDYSSRDAILRAARLLPPGGELECSRFLRLINRAVGSDPATPEVDLMVRTSGEQRLSDFLLWELAYAELLFVDRRWPDFRAGDLSRAVAAFRRRERRRGGLSSSRLVQLG